MTDNIQNPEELLADKLNLDILENICFGTGVEVNTSGLSKELKKHSNTIHAKVKELFNYQIIDRPIYPLTWMYDEYPLLVVAKADLPRTDSIDRFLKEDEHIFGAFYVKDKKYNTLLFEFHKDIHEYIKWKKEIIIDKKIPPQQTRFPTNPLFFSTKNFIKNRPHAPIYLMEKEYANNNELKINNYRMNALSYHIVEKLMHGSGIRTNEHLLSEKLKAHRLTIERRIDAMLKCNIISKPVCRFPRFFVPPGYILVYYLIEIRNSVEDILDEIENDPHIPLVIETMTDSYNFVLFGVFISVEESFEWEDRYHTKFPNCLGAMEKLYLSPNMTASIDQQDVAMGIIRLKKKNLSKTR